MILNDGLEQLIKILYATEKNQVKEALWAISNISASGKSHASAFIKSSAMPRVLNLVNDYNIDIQNESLWCICNALTCSGPEEARVLFYVEDHLVVTSLLKGLRIKDAKLL